MIVREADPVTLAVRDRLCVADGVVEAVGVNDWLGVEVRLPVIDGVRDSEGDPVALAVREVLWVTVGVAEVDGVSVDEGDAVGEGV